LAITKNLQARISTPLNQFLGISTCKIEYVLIFALINEIV